MDKAWLDRWNDRYRSEEFAYGTQPNVFLKEQLAKIACGKILFAAEGEGRNAVFAASLGWSVSAFDISKEGQRKALLLAQQAKIEISYEIGALEQLNYQSEQFDVIALIYAHFPASIKSTYHKKLIPLLKPGGLIIFEAFSKDHLQYNSANPKVGGPKDIDDLFSIEELTSDFSNFEILQLEQTEIELNEGHFHNGTGSVIRFIGRKKAA